MYGYESSLDYMPANEGIKDIMNKAGNWAKNVWAMIVEVGKELKMHMANVLASIKAKRASAEEVVASSSKAKSIINNLDNLISDLIKSCYENIMELQTKYTDTVSAAEYRANKATGSIDDDDDIDIEMRANTDSTIKRTGMYTHKKGMKKLYPKENLLTKDDIDKWNDETKWVANKTNLAAKFKENAENAVKIRADLNELSTMPLGVSELKSGYNTLKDIFNENGKFGNTWKTIVLAHDWSTGDIRSFLGKVVQMYKTGVNAANALGRKLTAKKIRDNEGNVVKNENGKLYRADKLKAINAHKERAQYKKQDAYDRKHGTGPYAKQDDEDNDTAVDSVTYDTIDAMMESSYVDGYSQAFVDMGIDPDDLAIESAFDSAYDDGYTQAMLDAGYTYA